MLKERFGSSIDKVILKISPAVARIPLSANQLTLFGVALSALAAVAFAVDQPTVAGLILIPAGLCDLFDGIVARARGTGSRAGAFFDSSMDRVSDLLIFGGMAVSASFEDDPARASLVMWALGGAVLTSYVRARAEVEIGEFKVGFLERAERFLILIPLAILGYLEAALWILAVGGTLTAGQRLFLGYRRIAAHEAERRRARTPVGDTPAPQPPAAGSTSQVQA